MPYRGTGTKRETSEQQTPSKVCTGVCKVVFQKRETNRHRNEGGGKGRVRETLDQVSKCTRQRECPPFRKIKSWELH